MRRSVSCPSVTSGPVVAPFEVAKTHRRLAFIHDHDGNMIELAQVIH
jgi:hypothetical protein